MAPASTVSSPGSVTPAEYSTKVLHIPSSCVLAQVNQDTRVSRYHLFTSRTGGMVSRVKSLYSNGGLNKNSAGGTYAGGDGG